MSKKKDDDNFIIAGRNKRAHFDYEIKEKFEVGLSLRGTEVKALRQGNVSLQEGFISHNNGELFLLGVTIPEYKFAGPFNHEPRRRRTLLLKKREIRKIATQLEQKGVTVVPITMYFNHKGIVKLSIGMGTGKKKADKRQTIKEREWQREKQRVQKRQWD